MMKPLFRRTYQSKTNCCCLSGGENLLYAGELGKMALRGFLLELNFCESLVACCSRTRVAFRDIIQQMGILPSQDKTIFQDSAFPSEEVVADILAHWLSIWGKIGSQRLFDVNLLGGLHRGLTAAPRFSLVVPSRGHFLVVMCGLLVVLASLVVEHRLQGAWASVVGAHGPSCPGARGIFPDQGLNQCPLRWQAGSQPLGHQGSP